MHLRSFVLARNQIRTRVKGQNEEEEEPQNMYTKGHTTPLVSRLFKTTTSNNIEFVLILSSSVTDDGDEVLFLCNLFVLR